LPNINIKGAAMGKKEKSFLALTEDFKTLIAAIPRLEAFLKAHKEIAAGYQKYRKSGGDAIPGIEKHLGVNVQKITPPVKKKKVVIVPEVKATEEAVEPKKAKKKSKK
jgi:hypothetical protein